MFRSGTIRSCSLMVNRMFGSRVAADSTPARTVRPARPVWGCLECSNAVITARKLPAILAFLDFIEDQRQALSSGDWAVKFGRAHARITTQIIAAFGHAIVADARRALLAEAAPLYLPPEARL